MHIKVEKVLNLWEEFVSLNHHKERDLSFLVVNSKSVYDLEGAEYVAILDNPYIIDPAHSSASWDREDLAIMDMILQAFQAIRPWCSNVLAHKGDYDEAQVDQALYYEKTEKERRKIRRFLRDNLEHKLGEFTNNDYYLLFGQH